MAAVTAALMAVGVAGGAGVLLFDAVSSIVAGVLGKPKHLIAEIVIWLAFDIDKVLKGTKVIVD